MLIRTFSAATLAASLALLACGSSSGTTAPRSCSWPTSLDPSDASISQCLAARTVLSCNGSNGTTEGCISNDPTQCPPPNLQPGVTFTCQEQCGTNEYGVGCGGPGPGPLPQPPAGCRTLGITPGGVSFSCCTCGP